VNDTKHTDTDTERAVWVCTWEGTEEAIESENLFVCENEGDARAWAWNLVQNATLEDAIVQNATANDEREWRFDEKRDGDEVRVVVETRLPGGAWAWAFDVILRRVPFWRP
jgi:hypothetical protein